MRKTLVILFALILTVILATASSAASDGKATVVLQGAEAKAGETVKVTVSLSVPVVVNTVGFTPDFDDALEYVSGRWLISGFDIVSAGTAADQSSVATFNSQVTLYGPIFEYTFRVREDADSGEYAVSLKKLNLKIYDGLDEVSIATEIVPSAVSVYDRTITFYAEDARVRAGGDVTVYVTTDEAYPAVTLAIYDLEYDSSALELVEGSWLLSGAMLKGDWDDTNRAVAAFESEKTLEPGRVFAFRFHSKADAEGDFAVSFKMKVTYGEDDRNALVISKAGTVTLEQYARGDVNGDGEVNSDDAICLLRHVLSGDSHPINQSGDMNGDKTENSGDAVHLLRHIMLPDLYPLF